jgi:hypothetical protein
MMNLLLSATGTFWLHPFLELMMSVIAQNRLQTIIKNHIKAGILKATHELFTFHDHNLRAEALSRWETMTFRKNCW